MWSQGDLSHSIMKHSSHFSSYCLVVIFKDPHQNSSTHCLCPSSTLLNFPKDWLTVSLNIFATQLCICNFIFKGFYNSNHRLPFPLLLSCKTFLQCSKRKKCNLYLLSHVMLCINFQAALLGGIHFSSKMAKWMPLGSDFALFLIISNYRYWPMLFWIGFQFMNALQGYINRQIKDIWRQIRIFKKLKWFDLLLQSTPQHLALHKIEDWTWWRKYAMRHQKEIVDQSHSLLWN